MPASNANCATAVSNVVNSLGCRAVFAFVVPRLGPLKTPATFLIYAFLSLKSRTFSLCDNRRPGKREKGQLGWYDRTMPMWTPPGIFFPIMWCLIITPLRALSSVAVHNATGGVAAVETTKWLVLHLCVGDVWNTINNVEGRLGTSALLVPLVVFSALNAGRQYAAVSAKAGESVRARGAELLYSTILTS